MSRLRFGVVLAVPEPAATEIDGIRRALGDPGLSKVFPHLTLIPPVNVAVDRGPEVCALLRAAASETEPFELTLGPVVTFAPVTPVLYLSVGGDGLDVVDDLRRRVFAGPLSRRLEHDFVPHVTVCEETEPARIDAALAALSGYEVVVRVDRLVLLRDHAPGPRRWNPVGDMLFERPLTVGAGGAPVEIAVSSVADAEIETHLEGQALDGPPVGASPFVSTARREGEIVAVARGWLRDGDVVVVQRAGDDALDSALRRAVLGSLLAA